MNKRLINLLKYFIGVGLGVTLLVFAFRDYNFAELQDELAHVNWGLAGAGILVGVLAHYIRAYRWWMLLTAADQTPTRWSAFWSVMVGYLANNAVPRLGEFTRSTMLARSQGVPFLSGMGTVVVERVIDVLMLGVFLLIGLALEFNKLLAYFDKASSADSGANESSGTSWLWYAFGAAAVLGLLGMGLIWLRRERIKQTTLGAKLFGFLDTLLTAISSIRRLKNVPVFVLASFGIWGAYIMATFILFQAIPAASGTSLYFAFMATIIGAIGMVLPVPGGIGPFHSAIIATFALFGLSEADGATAALILHSLNNLLVPTLLGAVGYFWLIEVGRRRDSALAA